MYSVWEPELTQPQTVSLENSPLTNGAFGAVALLTAGRFPRKCDSSQANKVAVLRFQAPIALLVRRYEIFKAELTLTISSSTVRTLRCCGRCFTKLDAKSFPARSGLVSFAKQLLKRTRGGLRFAIGWRGPGSELYRTRGVVGGSPYWVHWPLHSRASFTQFSDQ